MLNGASTYSNICNKVKVTANAIVKTKPSLAYVFEPEIKACDAHK